VNAIYHRQVLERALGDHVSPRALEAIYQANIGQDKLDGLLNHPEYHFDNNDVSGGLAYIEECCAIAVQNALAQPAEARAAFGRLTHAAQDFYSHSNYVALWAEQQAPHPNPLPVGTSADGEMESLPAPETIDGLDPDLLKHPRLITCRVYMPLEALSFVPGLGSLAKRFLPKDSHARMNLDNPSTGPLFPYSIEAAVQRTVAEYERTLALIGEEHGEEGVRAFQGM